MDIFKSNAVENFLRRTSLSHFMHRAQSSLGTPIIMCTIGFLAVLVHLTPFILYDTSHPLGYDTGFYRRYLTQPLISIPNSPVPGLGTDALFPRLAFDVLRSLHIPTDYILYGSYLFLFALLPILIFIFLRRSIGILGACIAALFLIFSPVQYSAFWYMLWKSAWALLFLILAFIAIDRRNILLAFSASLVIALSHKTTAITYLATLLILICVDRDRRKEFLALAALVASFLWITSSSVLVASFHTPPAAVFMSAGEYMRASIGFFILFPFSLYALREKRIPLSIIALFVFAALFPLFSLPFFERMFIFTDIALAVFAAFGALHLLSRIDTENAWNQTLGYASLLCIAIGFIVGMWWNEVERLQPLISKDDLNSIILIGNTIPSDALLLTSADEAPWFQGWTTVHVAAPGLLHDTHSLEEWSLLWSATSSEEQIAFLKDFPHPLYISTLGDFKYLIGRPAPCLKTVAPYLLLDSCAGK